MHTRTICTPAHEKERAKREGTWSTTHLPLEWCRSAFLEQMELITLFTAVVLTEKKSRVSAGQCGPGSPKTSSHLVGQSEPLVPQGPRAPTWLPSKAGLCSGSSWDAGAPGRPGALRAQEMLPLGEPHRDLTLVSRCQMFSPKNLVLGAKRQEVAARGSGQSGSLHKGPSDNQTDK